MGNGAREELKLPSLTDSCCCRKTDVVVIAALLIALFATVGGFFARGAEIDHTPIDPQFKR